MHYTSTPPPRHENKTSAVSLQILRHRPANQPSNCNGLLEVFETNFISTRESKTFGSLMGISLFLFVAGVLRGWLCGIFGSWLGMSFCRTWSLWDGEVGGTAGRLDDGMLHAWLCDYITPWVVDWWWVWNSVSVFLSRAISVTRSFVFHFLGRCRSQVFTSHEYHTTSIAFAVENVEKPRRSKDN